MQRMHNVSWITLIMNLYLISVDCEHLDGDDWIEYSERSKIKVKLVGATDLDRGVVLNSYNAG